MLSLVPNSEGVHVWLKFSFTHSVQRFSLTLLGVKDCCFFFNLKLFHKKDYAEYLKEFTKNTIVIWNWRTWESKCLGQSNVQFQLWLLLEWKKIRGKLMDPAAVTSKLLKWMLVRWEYVAQVHSNRVILYLKTFFLCSFFFFLSQPHNY